MFGQFISKEECVKMLESKAFKFSHLENGYMLFVNKSVKQLAEITIYSDGSASALFGKYYNF